MDKLEKRYNSNLGVMKEGKVQGYAVLWDKPSFVSSIGRKEVFKRGSLRITPKGCPLLFQHDKRRLLANSLSNTLILKDTPKGLYFEAVFT